MKPVSKNTSLAFHVFGTGNSGVWRLSCIPLVVVATHTDIHRITITESERVTFYCMIIKREKMVLEFLCLYFTYLSNRKVSSRSPGGSRLAHFHRALYLVALEAVAGVTSFLAAESSRCGRRASAVLRLWECNAFPQRLLLICFPYGRSVEYGNLSFNRVKASFS